MRDKAIEIAIKIIANPKLSPDLFLFIFLSESFIYWINNICLMKNPKNMTTEELIELADEIKRGMTTRVMRDLDKLESSRHHQVEQS